MPRLRRLTRDELTAEQAEVWDAIVGSRGGAGLDLVEDGSLIGPFNAFVTEPRVGRRLSGLGAHLRFATTLDPRLAELAICTVGAHWHSEFEFWAHASLARAQGIADPVLDALRDGRVPEFERDDERVVHATVHQLLAERRVDDATFAAAELIVGEVGLVELAALVGYYCTISITLNLFEVPLPEGEQPTWP